MRLEKIVSCFLIPLILLACLGRPTQEQNGLVVDEIENLTPTPLVQRMTPTQVVEQPITPTTELKSNEPSTPEPKVSPTDVNFALLCSPLADHSLDEIQDIVSDPYDPPPMGKDERHQGVDLAYFRRGERVSILGVGVQAILSGRVVSVIKDRLPYGNMVMIETKKDELPPEISSMMDIELGESLYHLYAHFGDVPEVEFGEEVDCGYKLGEVGMTGYNIVNPHLHLETRIGPAGNTFEVMSFYNTQASPVEMENYRLWRMSGEFRHFDPMILIRAFLGE
jgi:murein DD-endopeptidase MepM/ murein hydrolase activator NlpD